MSETNETTTNTNEIMPKTTPTEDISTTTAENITQAPAEILEEETKSLAPTSTQTEVPKETQASTVPTTEIENNQESLTNIQNNLQLIKNLENNTGKIQTDIVADDKGFQTYEAIGISTQNNYMLRLRDENGQEVLFPKSQLLTNSRVFTADLINQNFNSLTPEQQNVLINQAHEAGFLMARDIETLAETELGQKPANTPPNSDSDSTEYKEWQKNKNNWERLTSLLNEPVVSSENLQSALNFLNIPYSGDSLVAQTKQLEAQVSLLEEQLQGNITGEEKDFLKNHQQKLKSRIKAITNANTKLGEKFGNNRWSIVDTYQKLIEGEISSQEFNQRFESLFNQDEIQKLIDEGQLSEEKKQEFKAKSLKYLKIGGGIIGALLVLMIMQGMGGGGGQAG